VSYLPPFNAEMRVLPPPSHPWHTHQVDVDVLVDRGAVVSSVTFHPEGKPNETWWATANAKRKPGDKPDSRKGEQLAIGRALIELGKAFVNASNAEL
jgi:hypothetical protein